MSILVIGGHTRSVGKTSVVAGIITALPDFHWTALKITQYGHGICSANGEACDCVTADHSLAVSEEKDRSGDSDTSRFLVAGADHSWWVRTQQGELAECLESAPANDGRRDQVDLLARDLVLEVEAPTGTAEDGELDLWSEPHELRHECADIRV